MACHECEIPVSFLVDSGASCTQMDYSVFKAVADKQEFQLIPIRERFVLAMAKQNVCDEEVEKMLTNDVKEPSNRPWVAPIVMVTKKDGSIRFCVDYQKINFWLMKLPIHYLELMKPWTPWGCILALHDGLGKGFSNSRSCHLVFPMHLPRFRLMEKVLMGLQLQKCLVYLDDIIVFGRDFDEIWNVSWKG